MVWSRKFRVGLLVCAAASVGLRSGLVYGQADAIRVNNVPVEMRVGFVAENIVRYQFLPLDAQGKVVESEDGPLIVPQKWVAEPIKLRTLPERAVGQNQGGAVAEL